MTEPQTMNKDLLICALIHKLGGTTSLTQKDLDLGDVETIVTPLNTGTIHLEIRHHPPTPEQHFLAPAQSQPAATSNYPEPESEDDQDNYGLAMPTGE